MNNITENTCSSQPPAITLSARDMLLIALLGLGPLGGAFFLWDAALKRGDARQIGVLSFLTPLLSTLTPVCHYRRGPDFPIRQR